MHDHLKVPNPQFPGPVKRSNPLTQEEIYDQKLRAKAYARNHGELVAGENKLRQELLYYIVTIIDDERYQADPAAYLDAWAMERGGTEEYRFPDDNARHFFQLNL